MREGGLSLASKTSSMCDGRDLDSNGSDLTRIRGRCHPPNTSGKRTMITLLSLSLLWAFTHPHFYLVSIFVEWLNHFSPILLVGLILLDHLTSLSRFLVLLGVEFFLIHTNSVVEELQETLNNTPPSWCANYQWFLPPTSKIEWIVESRSRGCDEHQDGHTCLYKFGSPEHNTLYPVWVSIHFINLGKLDQRAHTRGITS
jgi:hypothetical protein